MTKFLNISVDNTLGGNSPSDVAVSSQKAVKEYVDAHSGGSVSVDDVTINRDSNQKLQAIGLINKNGESGAISPLGVWNGTETQWNQGEATTWYNWMYGGTSITSGTDLPTTNNFREALNDGTNVFFFSNDAGTYYYSSDGTNWSSGTTPVAENTVACHGNGIYLSFYLLSTSYAYSTNGTSWSSKTAPLSGVYDCVYGDKFVCVLSANAMYSTDGENWSTVSLPVEGYRVTYGNNLYVAMSSAGTVVYSSDGATWATATTSPTTVTGGYISLASGNGKYVALGYNGNTVAYSDDGDVWTTTTNLPRSQYWVSVTYGDGYFLAAGRDSQYAAYSTDGINWTEITLPASGRYYGVTYMGDTFYGVSASSTSTFKVSFASLDCFTAEQNPTTASTVYDAVSVPSALTITSVGTGNITLSDGKTYAYNPSGNDFSYRSIGEVHPDWLCNINGVGVKIGDEFIANNSNGGSSRNIGEIIQSTIPLTDAGLHLLDGSLISGSGSYSAFVTYISGLVTDYPDLFVNESDWQTAVTTYGVCGKFVYDSVNNTVRLPKYSNKIYTSAIATTAGVKGDGKTLGLTDGTTTSGLNGNRYSGSTHYGLTGTGSAGTAVGTTGAGTGSLANNVFAGITTDKTKSGIIADLSNITTALDGYYYIVIANSTKTNIEVDIDEVMTDLNGKADVDLSNVNASGTSLASGWAMPSDRYIDLTLGASGSTYTAPANGYIYFSKNRSGSSNQYAVITGASDGIPGSLGDGAQADGYGVHILRPIKKGTTFKVTYTLTGATHYFRFVYAEGDQ